MRQSVNMVRKDMNLGNINFGAYTLLLSGGLIGHIIAVQITIFGLTHVDPNFYLRKPFTLLILLLRSKNCFRLSTIAIPYSRKYWRSLIWRFGPERPK